ncbi:34-kDa subunit of RNA polymerase III (C) [Malassezia psittaci]|uniref:34-kDa subunit of RNA polymerase III (C) n=1 Tax=Malassezia psittaci TaxID=1821823 RepID=A0AAF0FCJ5_9BASI|nr:34-kDa subunit of RNA polymerase III (C) [Malassezia psittaci]
MPKRKTRDGDELTQLEKRVHAAALAAPNLTLTGESLAAEMSDVAIEEQLLAINGLLKKSLLNAQKGPHGIQYVAVTRDEASLLGSMDTNEMMIYNHIKDAKNEGIWTKMIKARTNLHQTVLNRCLKSLEQKQLVKAVKSVKFPTRKIYMLYNLTPSIELSGGPWYTDNELDTGFIHELSMACLRYVQSQSWPKEGRSSALYPASHTPNLPTASSVHRYLKAARITDTELELEHIVALLDLLIYDNHIEKIPVLPKTNTHRSRQDAMDDGTSSDSSDDDVLRRKGSSMKGGKNSRKRVRPIATGHSSSAEDTSDGSSNSNELSSERTKPSHKNRSKSRNNDATISSDEDSSEDQLAMLTHVPYVYRAVKPILPPHGGTTSCYVPLSAPWLQIPTTNDQYDAIADSAELFFNASNKHQTNAVQHHDPDGIQVD